MQTRNGRKRKSLVTVKCAKIIFDDEESIEEVGGASDRSEAVAC